MEVIKWNTFKKGICSFKSEQFDPFRNVLKVINNAVKVIKTNASDVQKARKLTGGVHNCIVKRRSQIYTLY